MNKPLVLIIVALTLLLSGGCAMDSDEKRRQAIRADAEEFLSYLRAGEWEKATDRVLLNDAAYHRFSLPKETPPEVIRKKTKSLFIDVYSHTKPGNVISIRIDPKDSNLALVTYRHGDLDGFNMRFLNGKWLYTFK